MEGSNNDAHQSSRENLPTPEVERRQLLQYIAGYFDASGTVSVQHNKPKPTEKRGESFALRIEIERVRPTVANLMQEIFPSFTTEREMREKITHRWVAKSARASFILETISPYLHIKAGQAQTARDYSSTKTHNRTKEESLEFDSRIKELNKHPQVDLTASFELPYLAGIFDAHGYVLIGGHERNDVSIRIGLKNQEFMETLGKQLQANITPNRHNDVIENYSIKLSSKKAKELLLQLIPFLRINKQLASLAIQFQDIRNATSTLNLKERKEKEGQIVELFKEECIRLQRTPHDSSKGLRPEN